MGGAEPEGEDAVGRTRRGFALFALFLGVTGGACGNGDGPGIGPVGPQGDVGPGEITIEGDRVEGSGDVTSEARPVSGFDAVVLSGEGLVVIDRGDPGLVVETDDNLHADIETEVVGSELHIRTAEGVDIDPTSAPVYRVTVPSLVAVELAGAGEIRASDWAPTAFTVRLSGAGDITVEGLAVAKLTVELTGVGELMVSGSADEVKASVGGVTEYDGADLRSRVATITCSGNGTATVWATDSLDVEITDAASVFYYGEPEVSESIGDAGSLVSLGAGS